VGKSLKDLLENEKKNKDRLEKFLKEQNEDKQINLELETEQPIIEEETKEEIKEEEKPKRGRKPKNREYLVVEDETEVQEEIEE